MEHIESISLLQRIASAIANDLEGIETQSAIRARSKMDILIGEMDLFRQDILKEIQEKIDKEEQEAIDKDLKDVIDVEVE